MTTQPRIHGRYRVDERLGATRIATVYRAYDDKLSRTVLLNLMRNHLVDQKGIRARFISDSELRARNVHSALPEVYDSGTIEERPFFITEFITGKTLRERAPFSPLEALQYLKHIVGVINACQQSGIPHPPISSNDFVVVSEGHVKWIENWLLGPHEVLIDVASYRAPEREESAPETQLSSVYAVGVLLYEMISGHRPFIGNSAEEIYEQHTTHDITPVSAIIAAYCPPQIDELIMRCSARNPKNRIATLDELLHTIEQFRREMLVESSPETAEALGAASTNTTDIYKTTTRVTDQGWKRHLRTLLIAVALVAAAGVGWVAIPGLITPYLGSGSPTAPADTPTTEASLEEPLPADTAPTTSIGEQLMTSFDNAVFAVEDFMANDLVVPSWMKSLLGGAPDEPTWLLVGGDALLELRDDPSNESLTIAQIPAGTRVEWIDGPQSSDGIAWLRIRYNSESGVVEGWARQSRLVVPSP